MRTGIWKFQKDSFNLNDILLNKSFNHEPTLNVPNYHSISMYHFVVSYKYHMNKIISWYHNSFFVGDRNCALKAR